MMLLFRYDVKLFLYRSLFLLVTLGELLDKLILRLNPDEHMFEWMACFGGSMTGQIISPFKADSLWRGFFRMIGGFIIGYLAGLYGGPVTAKYFGWDDEVGINCGRFVVAGLADITGRCLSFVLSHPTESADFVIEKGQKIVTIIGNDVVMKGIDYLLEKFGKKK